MRTLAGKETLPDNGVLLTLASLSRTRSLTLTGSELGTSTATVSRTLAAARAFFGDEPDVLIVRSGHPLVRISRERGALTLEDLRAYPKVRISNVTHNFSAAVVRFHASLMAHEREGARMLARYLPIEILPLPPGLAGRYERRVIWHENASGDPALMWLIAMLRSASAQEACAGSAQAGRLIGRPHEEKARRCRTKKRAASFRRRPDSRPGSGSITPSS